MSEARIAYEAGWRASQRTKTYDLDAAERRFEAKHGHDYGGSAFAAGWTDHAAGNAKWASCPGGVVQPAEQDDNAHDRRPGARSAGPSDHSPRPPANAVPSPGEESAWGDDPNYPHRIENHVKVYLHLEESSTQPLAAARDCAPAGTRVYHRGGTGDVVYGTVTGWTTDGTSVFVSFDQGGTYAGPTFGSVFVADTGVDRAEAIASRWVVSDVTTDGYPLDGVEGGHYCDYEGHPPGARPDWDRQHREAAAVHLPTAEELLPLLATAVGRSIDGPTVEQRRAASDLLAEHARWSAERAGLSAGEAAGRVPAASDWHDSDDAGCDLADRAIALLAEVTGQLGPTGDAGPSAPSGVPLMRSALDATSATPSVTRDQEPPGTFRPRSGPAR